MLPVNSCSVTMQSCVPVHGQKLHTANGMIIPGPLKMTLQQLQRHAAEVIHCEHKQEISLTVYCVQA